VRTTANQTKQIKLKFCGLQQVPCGNTFEDGVYVPLWTLLEEIKSEDNGGVGFIASSTLSETTLKRCGFHVPDPTGWQIGKEFNPSCVLV
jgi:hypothetical protein